MKLVSLFGNLTWSLGTHLCNELVWRHQRCSHPCDRTSDRKKGSLLGLHGVPLASVPWQPESSACRAHSPVQAASGNTLLGALPSCQLQVWLWLEVTESQESAPCVPNCRATHAHRMTVAQEPGGTPASSPTCQGAQDSFAGLELLQSLVSALTSYACAGRILWNKNSWLPVSCFPKSGWIRVILSRAMS